MTTQYNTLEGERYTAQETQKETQLYLIAEANDNISDSLFKDRTQEILTEVFK